MAEKNVPMREALRAALIEEMERDETVPSRVKSNTKVPAIKRPQRSTLHGSTQRFAGFANVFAVLGVRS